MNCRECKFSQRIPGDVHIACKHPATIPIWSNPLAEMISLMGKRAGNIDLTDSVIDIDVEGDEHGKKNGWFNWPTNFDPIWLRKCTGFEKRENSSD